MYRTGGRLSGDRLDVLCLVGRNYRLLVLFATVWVVNINAGPTSQNLDERIPNAFIVDGVVCVVEDNGL